MLNLFKMFEKTKYLMHQNTDDVRKIEMFCISEFRSGTCQHCKDEFVKKESPPGKKDFPEFKVGYYIYYLACVFDFAFCHTKSHILQTGVTVFRAKSQGLPPSSASSILTFFWS